MCSIFTITLHIGEFLIEKYLLESSNIYSALYEYSVCHTPINMYIGILYSFTPVIPQSFNNANNALVIPITDYKIRENVMLNLQFNKENVVRVRPETPVFVISRLWGTYILTA